MAHDASATRGAAARATGAAAGAPVVRLRNLAGELLGEVEAQSLQQLKEEAGRLSGVACELLTLVSQGAPLEVCEPIGEEVMVVVDTTPYYTWDVVGNPDSQYLARCDGTVTFVNVGGGPFSYPDYVNVLTQVPIQNGRHYVEFIMHELQDEQWCGVTMSPDRAGIRGGGVHGFYYYSGRRSHTWGALHALRERQRRMDFEHVKNGDVIGLFVDADRGAAIFCLNGQLQGGCRLPNVPLYFCTALDAEDDRVELRRREADEFPYKLEDILGTPKFLSDLELDPENATRCEVAPDHDF